MVWEPRWAELTNGDTQRALIGKPCWFHWKTPAAGAHPPESELEEGRAQGQAEHRAVCCEGGLHSLGLSAQEEEPGEDVTELIESCVGKEKVNLEQ